MSKKIRILKVRTQLHPKYIKPSPSITLALTYKEKKLSCLCIQKNYQTHDKVGQFQCLVTYQPSCDKAI